MTSPRLRAALDELAMALLEEARGELSNGHAAPDSLLSVDEAAEQLGVGRTMVYQQMATGRLRSVRVGRRRLVPSSALAVLMDPDNQKATAVLETPAVAMPRARVRGDGQHTRGAGRGKPSG